MRLPTKQSTVATAAAACVLCSVESRATASSAAAFQIPVFATDRGRVRPLSYGLAASPSVLDETIESSLDGDGEDERAPLSSSRSARLLDEEIISPSFGGDNDDEHSRRPFQSPELDQYRAFDPLRSLGLDRDVIGPFFRSRPHLVARRFFQVARTLTRARSEWEATAPNVTTDDEESMGSMDGFDGDDDLDIPPTKRDLLLCERISSLGPVAVKVAQTLSQRPDIVGNDAARAFKRLQTNNVPFEDDVAWAIVRESLGWDGPIGPGVGEDYEIPRPVAEYNAAALASTAENEGVDAAVSHKFVDRPEETIAAALGGVRNATARPLFASITAHPVAVASLGQVYRATTHSGRDVAVKVQRPDAMAILAADAACFRLVFMGRNLWQSFNGVDGGVDEGQQDVGSVIDRVARDILDELDYDVEAANSVRFRESLGFLGYVTTPTLVPELSTDRVLVTEWVDGKHLSELTKEEGLAMTRMAVEACTASMVLTGYVHADPHEGNIMLDSSGRVVFLDFGLMSIVEPESMEAFARGIQACLAEDWLGMTRAQKMMGFVTDPIQYRKGLNETWRVYGIDEETGEDLGEAALAQDLAEAMMNTEGGMTSFGALFTVLNKELSPNWLLFTPPYVLLLIRTFLTLEGIATRVDPDFNIYEMALPWAFRRSLSPMTVDGTKQLRSMLLTEDNRVQWDQLFELANNQRQQQLGDGGSASATGLANPKEAKSGSNALAREAIDTVGSLLGSSDGRTLRRAISDLDAADLLNRMAFSRQARPLRRSAASAAGGEIVRRTKRKLVPIKRKLRPNRRGQGVTAGSLSSSPPSTTAMESSANGDRSQGTGSEKREAVGASLVANARPSSAESLSLRARQSKWKRRVSKLLAKSHIVRQVRQGGFRRGIGALFAAWYLAVRITAGAVLQAVRLTLQRAAVRIRENVGGEVSTDLSGSVTNRGESVQEDTKVAAGGET
uniref:ABC1 atypical kinase-like domain-containing protein n=1 Tax=Odontella aurita TaxID=265563 RepID=A0A7S4NDW2_9STRA|mmetsp:Transcript_60630/g.179769  ORF Transcript_60630/g.179769 Transcript_60630/m.179769 type:complete len:960 (+) Transcript_60630:243-3122(+)